MLEAVGAGSVEDLFDIPADVVSRTNSASTRARNGKRDDWFDLSWIATTT